MKEIEESVVKDEIRARYINCLDAMILTGHDVDEIIFVTMKHMEHRGLIREVKKMEDCAECDAPACDNRQEPNKKGVH